MHPVNVVVIALSSQEKLTWTEWKLRIKSTEMPKKYDQNEGRSLHWVYCIVCILDHMTKYLCRNYRDEENEKTVLHLLSSCKNFNSKKLQTFGLLPYRQCNPTF